MSDTLDAIDPGVLRMPNSTGENTVEAYGVWYPYDGLLVPEDTLEDTLDSVRWRTHVLAGPPNAGVMAVKITIERIDPE